jgi:hypothetical protein
MIHKPKYKRVLFVPDIHAPFEDGAAIKCLLAFAKWWKPDRVYILGDTVDFYQLSKFDKDPARLFTLQEDIDAGKKILAQISNACPNASKLFIPGNHEFRLQRYLWTRAAELAGLRELQLPKLLGLQEMGYEYLKFGRTTYRGMAIKHGDLVRKDAGYTAKGELENTGLSGVSVHTHRLAVHAKTNEAGSFLWMEAGCLCLLNPSYMMGKVPNWQQGFGIGFFKEGSKRFHMDRVPIINHKAMHGGYEFY